VGSGENWHQQLSRKVKLSAPYARMPLIQNLDQNALSASLRTIEIVGLNLTDAQLLDAQSHRTCESISQLRRKINAFS
jgi:hypothetical protein